MPGSEGAVGLIHSREVLVCEKVHWHVSWRVPLACRTSPGTSPGTSGAMLGVGQRDFSQINNEERVGRRILF